MKRSIFWLWEPFGLTMAFLDFIDFLNYRLHGELVDRRQWEALPRTTNGHTGRPPRKEAVPRVQLVTADGGLSVQSSPGMMMRC